MSRLKDKIIFVPGGKGLLGRAVAARIQSEGGVCIAGEKDLATDIAKNEVNCDVTQADSVTAAISAITKSYGRIDGLVNMAYPRTPDWGKRFEDIQLESWKTNVDMQMNSVFFLCQQVLQAMKHARTGSVVNVASIYGVVGPDFSVYDGTQLTMPAAYAAIKGGVINLTKYLAAYFGPDNIRVNCVSPGGIFDSQPQAFVNNYEKKVPMRRMGTPEDIAAPICFLLSDEAAYVNGHNLVVDGGWTII